MSNKSGVASQVVALPSGGGALRGLGETFSADPFTGTGTVTVPVMVPPGRNGLQPELALRYSTGHGNGPFGLGWTLGVPEVTRRADRGVPRYNDDDEFRLSSEDDLVPLGAGAFRPRAEGSFRRIRRVRSERDDFWRVESRDGRVDVFGTPGAAGSDLAVCADPDDRTKVLSWRLTSTVDPLGNRIEFAYRPGGGDDGAHHWDQVYLEQVAYIDTDDGFLATVGFDYEPRPDAFSSYRGGFEVRTTERCRRIDVRTDAPVRTYELDYATAPANRVSLLERITLVGHDGDRGEALPPLKLDYTAFAASGSRFAPFPDPADALPPKSLAADDLELVDLFGDGLPDLVQLDGSVQFWRNRGGGVFDEPQEMPEMPPGVRLQDAGVQLADLDGDGRADLLVAEREGYFPSALRGGWAALGFVQYEQVPQVGLDDADVRLIDLDGDGVVDALRTDVDFELFFNDRRRGWTDTASIPRGPIDRFPNVSFSDDGVELADLSGDGLQDIVLVEDGRLVYWPYLGHGRWGRRTEMDGAPVFSTPEQPFDAKRLIFADVDGDGLDDLVYVEPDRVRVWINQSGNAWAEQPTNITATPAFDDIDGIRVVDMLGTGTPGILWTIEPAAGAKAFEFLDLTEGRKPYLLSGLDNGLGAVTRIGYAPSTDFYRADEQQPQTSWRTPLPFPIQVVARVEVIDQLSGGKLTTEYDYHHGCWDGLEREFCGFGLVEQRDSEDFVRYHSAGLHGEEINFAAVNPRHFAPPTLTRTWFHVGPVGEEFEDWRERDLPGEPFAGDPQRLGHTEAINAALAELPDKRARRDALRTLRGKVLRTELYGLDGSQRATRPYTVTEFAYGVRPVEGAFFPHTAGTRVTEWERGDEPASRLTFTEHDDFGLPTRTIALATPRRPGEPHLGTTTIASYARATAASGHLVDRPARVTTFAIEDDGGSTVFELRDAVRASTARLTLIADRLNHYDGAAFEGRPLGAHDGFGALVRSEALVLPEERLEAAFGPQPPPYLRPDGPPEWTPEYPEEFRAGLAPLAGYDFAADDAVRHRGYYVSDIRLRYDFHDGPGGRGLVRASLDALGGRTTLGYDRFDLLAVEVTDPVGLRRRVTHDYRVMQPREITDANGNRVRASYTPLGLVETTAELGKNGDGDPPDAPGTRFLYDFRAFAERRQPISARTIRPVDHGGDETIETVEYSDGFGRVLQVRTHAPEIGFGDPAFGHGVLPLAQDDPATGDPVTGRAAADLARPAVTVSGWQTFDNKGRVVETHEPFTSQGWEFAPPTDAELGHRTTMFYDPRGHVVRTVNPDGSEHALVLGIPVLDDPSAFTPTPWEAFTYDANDNAGRTDPDASRRFDHLWNTPDSIELDPLGRVVRSTERHRTRDDRDTVEELSTRFSFDVRGNLRSVTDAAGRTAAAYVYDLADRPLRIETLDGGVRRLIVDAAGSEIEHRTSRGTLVLQRYDALQRLVRRWARDDAESPVGLRERLEYGDDSRADQPTAERAAAAETNRLGALKRVFDAAGLATIDRYDFKGNALERTRQVIADAAILESVSVDWQPTAGETLKALAARLLDPTRYETSSVYDALDRPVTVRLPQDVLGRRRELRIAYDRDGSLRRYTLDEQVLVDHISYNASGWRTLVALGNGILTRYGYEPRTGRLARLRSERFTSPAPFRFEPGGVPFQELAYEYDLTGNILAITDRTPGSGVRANADAARVADPVLSGLVGVGDALVRTFTYDSLYRLVRASGRRCAVGPPQPFADHAGCGFDIVSDGREAATLATTYAETYGYDAVGNLVTLTHDDSVRTYELVPGHNRLRALTASGTAVDYSYDDDGNLVAEGPDRRFAWNFADQLKSFRAGSEVHYLRDGAGAVVKRLTRIGDEVESVVTIDGSFEHHVWADGANNLASVAADGQRLCVLRIGPAHPGDHGPATQFHLGDHLGSSNVVVDQDGGFVNREEYSPYGETTFGGFAGKRHRFTGNERDAASALDDHGARHYAPWLCRWISCDPAGLVDGPNPYAYVTANPLGAVDPTGRQSEPARQQWLYEARAFWQEVTATASTPGYGPKLRRIYQHLGRLWGDPGKVDVGHPKNRPFWSLRAGEKVHVFPEPSAPNRAGGFREALARAEAKAKGLFARERNRDPTVVPGQSPRNQMQLSPALRDLKIGKIAEPPATPPARLAAAPPPPSPAGVMAQLDLPLPPVGEAGVVRQLEPSLPSAVASAERGLLARAGGVSGLLFKGLFVLNTYVAWDAYKEGARSSSGEGVLNAAGSFGGAPDYGTALKEAGQLGSMVRDPGKLWDAARSGDASPMSIGLGMVFGWFH